MTNREPWRVSTKNGLDSGYPGEAYRLGFAWLMSVGFMMAIVVFYLILPLLGCIKSRGVIATSHPGTTSSIDLIHPR